MGEYICFAIYCFNVVISGIVMCIISLLIAGSIKCEEPKEVAPIAFCVSQLVIGGLILWIMKLYGYL